MNKEQLLRVAAISEKWMDLEIINEESLRNIVFSLSEMEKNHDFAQHIQNEIINGYLNKPSFSARQLNSLFEVLLTADEDVALSAISGMIECSCLSLENLHHLVETGIGAKYNVTKKLERQLFLTRLRMFEKELLDATSNGDPIIQAAVFTFLDDGIKPIAQSLMLNGSNKKIRNLSKALYLSSKKKKT